MVYEEHDSSVRCVASKGPSARTFGEWTAHPPAANGPSPRVSHAMAWDGKRKRVVLFGGQRSTPLGDTWVWDGASWADLTPANGGPLPRSGHAMAYDAARERVVLFGGRPASDATTDTTRETWEWDGATWTLADGNSGALYGIGHSTAFDPLRRKVIAFSGKETWSWDGESWSLVALESDSPPSRGYSTMAWDGARGRVIVFGGLYNAAMADTWELVGAVWRELTPPLSPPKRQYHAMTWDAHRRRVVLFGGSGDSHVWEWNGAAASSE